MNIVQTWSILLGLSLGACNGASIEPAHPDGELYYGGDILTMSGNQPHYIEALVVDMRVLVEVVDAAGRVCDIAPVWPDGRYQVSHLLPGDYKLNLQVPEQTRSASRSVRVRSASVRNVDFDMGQVSVK